MLAYSVSHCFAVTAPNAAVREKERLEKKRELMGTAEGDELPGFNCSAGIVMLSLLWEMSIRNRSFVVSVGSGWSWL